MNKLSTETSPYLKQHQHNPVLWYAWGPEAWRRAKEEDKLVLISIGYSACHWCHVMERESFEDDATAAIMNEHFICIKVDREERPDVDQVYMEAVQLIHGSGGWPLNCFTLPDGRPIHGGTYFRNPEWRKMLLTLSDFYKAKKEDALDYASRLVSGMQQNKIVHPIETEFKIEKLDSIVLNWQNYFDVSEGGQDREPKFPLPNNYEFLLHFGAIRKNKFILNFLHLTLHKMAWGGIYDQVGGGFARYSVDRLWHVPHFEKMLYDNAQLISLYSKTAQLVKTQYYFNIIEESIAFVLRELTNLEGGFYCALDADSEGVEGKFYTWTKEEFLETIAAEDFGTSEFAARLLNYYHVTESGNWVEEETNILKLSSNTADFCQAYGLDENMFVSDLEKAKKLLLHKRSYRIRPGLDDKILTSWNAMMIKALTDAYCAGHQPKYLEEAEKHYAFIKANLMVGGILKHTYHYGVRAAKINAFFDDYTFLADASIALYQATFKESYLLDANFFAQESIKHFLDPETGLFFYNSKLNEDLFVRKHEVHDNVIPSSNGVMATILYKLGRYFEQEEYTAMSLRMLQSMQSKFAGYPSGYSQWLQLQIMVTFGLNTICITGQEAINTKLQFDAHYLPNVIYAGGTSASIPMMQNKASIGNNDIHICSADSCMPPVATVEEAIKLLA